MSMTPDKFVYNGQRLALRVINKDLTSHGGFVNSNTPGDIIRPNKWVKDTECGNGIHVWPLGMSRAGKVIGPNHIVQLVEITGDSIYFDGKAKCEEIKVIDSGNLAEMTAKIIPAHIAFCQAGGFSASLTKPENNKT